MGVVIVDNSLHERKQQPNRKNQQKHVERRRRDRQTGDGVADDLGAGGVVIGQQFEAGIQAAGPFADAQKGDVEFGQPAVNPGHALAEGQAGLQVLDEFEKGFREARMEGVALAISRAFIKGTPAAIIDPS